MDFVPETNACGTTLEIALVSGPSPVGVAVAWAFTWPTSCAAQARVLEGGHHRAFDAAALLIGGCNVVGVGSAAVACDGGDRLRAPALGVFLAFEDHGARALAHHEAVATLVEGTACAGRVVVAAAHGAYRAEASHGEGRDRGLGRAGDHHVGVSAPDQL